jgi:probable F420-dependent oxidoreductase
MTFSGVWLNGPTIADHVNLARAAEAAGYASAWATEVSGPDAVTVLAASAAATSRIRLGTGIVAIGVRSPYLMAMTLASLQDLSGGRISAGFGTSTPAIVSGWHGLPYDPRRARVREYVELVRSFIAGERVKHDGLYTVRGAALRGRPGPRVPVYLAALNPRMLELAGEIADGVILNFPTPGYVARALAAIRRGLERAGRQRTDIDIVANLRAGIGSYEEIAPPLKREFITYFFADVYRKAWRDDGFGDDLDRAAERWQAGDRAGATAGISSAFVNAHAVIGSAAECRAAARGFLDLGIDNIVLFPVIPDGPDGPRRTIETVEALAGG